jgi:ferredoxin
MPALTVTTLAVDRIVCDGYGICAELLPELIDLDDWGYPIISPEPVKPNLRDHAQRAVAMCPVLALSLRSAPGPAVAPAPRQHRRRASGARR